MNNKESQEGVLNRVIGNPVTAPYLALIILFVIASFISPSIFPTVKNIGNLFRQASIVGVVSIGMTVVLLIGGIDLSVSYVMAISACLVARMSESMLAAGHDGIAAGPVLLVLLIGLVVGFLNGTLIIARHVEPFIITLGVGEVLKGITYIYTGGSPGGKVTTFWKTFGSGSLFGVVPFAVVLYIILMAVFMLLLHKSVYGRYVYAVGSNPEAARLSGINVTKIKLISYMLCGLTAAMAGVMLAARVRVGEPNGSSGYDMDAIAAVVIGGTSMAGGRGLLICTFAGVMIMTIINNVLNLMGADPNLQMVIKGCVILLAVLVQRKES